MMTSELELDNKVSRNTLRERRLLQAASIILGGFRVRRDEQIKE